MSNHPTRLLQRLSDTGEVEIITHDPAVRHKAMQARLHQTTVDFVFWNGESDEIIEGRVSSCAEEPFRFAVKRQPKGTSMQPKIAETARQEREQGGQPQAASSGDPSTNTAAGPHDKPSLATDATKGTGMLPAPGKACDNDMAPGG